MLIALVTNKPKYLRKIRSLTAFSVAVALMTLALPTVAQATFTIIGSFPSMTASYGVGSIPLVAPISNSPAPWTFTSSNPKVATISGKSINIVGVGSSNITAAQSATGKFTARSCYPGYSRDWCFRFPIGRHHSRGVNADSSDVTVRWCLEFLFLESKCRNGYWRQSHLS